MLEISNILRTEFGNRRTFPRCELPKFMVKLAAPAAKLTRRYVERNVGWPLAFDNARTRAELGVEFRPAAESITEHFRQMEGQRV